VPRQVQVRSGYSHFSVLERLALKAKFPRELTGPKAKKTVAAETVPLINRPRAAHHSARAWSQASGSILIGTSITIAAAALFVVWGLYGSELEELSLGNATKP
jgi:hypothetical protein